MFSGLVRNGNGFAVNGDISQTISENKDWKYFWNRVIKDVKNRDLAPVKILFFFKYATLFVLYPFLTLHMAELGLDEYEIGINQATAPLIAILGPPFVGIIADKIGNFKILLSLMTLMTAGFALLLLLVPVARETVSLPSHITFELKCNNSVGEFFILESIDESICTLNLNSSSKNIPLWSNLPPTSLYCGSVCSSFDNDTQSIKHYSNFADVDLNKDPSLYLPNGQELVLQEIQPHLNCKQNDSVQEICSLDYDRATRNVSGALQIKSLILNPNSRLNGVNATKLRLDVNSGFSLNGIKMEETRCKGSEDGKEEEERSCSSKCVLQYERKLFCTNNKERKVYNVGLTFGIYTLFRILLGFASATSFVMFEGAVLAIMKQFGGDYGLQRVFATLAAIIVAPLSGTMLNSFGFRPVICLYAALNALSALVTLAIDLQFKKPAEKVISNLKDVLCKAEILIFFLAMLWSGTVWGYLETFLFLYIEKLGGSRLLMGLTISVGGVAGLPVLIFSRPIIKRFGHVNCLCLGLLFYFFRYFGYSIITDPWQCLIFEALEAVTVSLAITAASTYAVALSNLETIASIQGIFGCLYFGIGRGAGSFIGGMLIKSLGHVKTFRVFGVGSLIGAVLYFLVNFFYLRKHSIAHTGLDINNLHLHSQQNLTDTPLKKSKSKISLEKGQGETELEPQLHAGYIGPLAVSKFTDIPLDEDGL